MKKNLKKREPEKTRRLTLSRETLKILEDPQLLALAEGGNLPTTTDITTSGAEISTQGC